ncbi:MAG: glycosyltransferase family 2 protein [Patescibacteria group bacterium]|jgi:glycosyltransferase involved in cell wall biosynthesis|nr:glycosyltransferase family 2 protein [Patescibacteria group bacterium]
MPAVSVLMPAYNAAPYLKQSIDSIISQTFTDWELLIVDDASTDDTGLIVQAYAAADSRIKVFKNEINLGIAASRNRLLSLARGEYIAWQDADDISEPSRLAKQYQFMTANPQVGICGGYLVFFDDHKSFGIRQYEISDHQIRKNIFRFSPVAQPAAMIRADVFAKVGTYQPGINVAEDLLMSFKIGRYYQFANLPEVLVKYRQQPNSITFKKLKVLELNTLKIRWQFHNDPNYQFSLVDYVYNILQFLTLYLSPARFRIWAFNLVRNSKI